MNTKLFLKLKNHIINTASIETLTKIRWLISIQQIYTDKFKYYFYKYSDNLFNINDNYKNIDEWYSALDYYKNSGENAITIKLKWAHRPWPGNFGDWLSPYIINKLSNCPVEHMHEVSNQKIKHMIAIGSIASVANEYSFVIGAGANNNKSKLPKAYYSSVRGPKTAALILVNNSNELGISYGDLGYLLCKVYKPKSRQLVNDILFAPHINQYSEQFELPLNWKLIDIRASHPTRIENIIDQLLESRLVITSAMHILIACQSYGVPCILVDLSLLTRRGIPGDGLKYDDAQQGIGLISRPLVKLSNMEELKTIASDTSYVCDFPNKTEIDKLFESSVKAIDRYLKWVQK
jgi:hypothetical protein